jgi:hypothetical protein
MELDDTPSGRMERWRADALLVGETSGLTALSKQVQTDAVAVIDDIEAREEALSAREQACDERERAHAVSVAQFVDFVGKASVLFDRIQKARADQMEEPIAAPPNEISQERLHWHWRRTLFLDSHSLRRVAHHRGQGRPLTLKATLSLAHPPATRRRSIATAIDSALNIPWQRNKRNFLKGDYRPRPSSPLPLARITRTKRPSPTG